MYRIPLSAILGRLPIIPRLLLVLLGALVWQLLIPALHLLYMSRRLHNGAVSDHASDDVRSQFLCIRTRFAPVPSMDIDTRPYEEHEMEQEDEALAYGPGQDDASTVLGGVPERVDESVLFFARVE
jgi:hypothetical protein